MIVQIDKMNWRGHSLLVGAALAYLLTMIIIGAAGPKVYKEYRHYAYNCPGDSHAWNPTTCTGIQMRNGTTWTRDFGQFNLMNKAWILEVTPFKFQSFEDEEFNKDLTMRVTILGTNDAMEEESKWRVIKRHDAHTNYMICKDAHRDVCNSFILIDMEFLEYRFYRIEVQALPSSALPYLGDVQFSLFTFTMGFSELELAFRMIYLAVAVLVIIFLIRMRTPFISWSLEHKSLFFLILGLGLYNDIFYPFQFWLRGWFFDFLSSVFEALFVAMLLLFWLQHIDRIRLVEDEIRWLVWSIPKILLTAIYAILAIAFYTWVRIRGAEDPVYGERDKDELGPVVLFYLVSAAYGLNVIWLATIVVITVPAAIRNRSLLSRFLYFACPAFICIFASVISIFAGAIGPFNRGSLSFVVLYGLYNSYVWVLFILFWPEEDSQHHHQSGDSTTTLKGAAGDRKSVV